MNRLNALQGLRFLGFMLIFLEHAGGLLWKNHYMSFGSRGVEIFFVLSGFLIAYNYRNNYRKLNCTPSLKSCFKYMLAKMQKFYVLHIVIFLTIVVIHMAKGGFKYPDGVYAFIRDAFLNIMLLQSWYAPSKFAFNGVTWFLSSILFIYFCVPYIVFFFKKNRGGGDFLFCYYSC